MKVIILVLIGLSLGACTANTPYKVCDDTNTCRAVSHEEAISAAEVAKEWGKQSTLTLKINRK